MKILVIGGTRLVGRSIVEAAIARGHDVTLFNRGNSDPAAFPDVEHVTGDRETDLGRLGARRFDALVDSTAYFPRQVDATRGIDAGRRLLVSTLSVYREFGERDVDEHSRVHDPLEHADAIDGGNYGALKVACEDHVRAVDPAAIVLRYGLVGGAGDTSERLGAWIRRVARGGEVLAPGPSDSPLYVIDARDAGAFAVSQLERGTAGTFDLNGPRETFGAMLDAARSASGSDARFVWVDEGWLQERGLGYWSAELPLWVGTGLPGGCTAARARAEGLAFRPLADTVRDWLAWDRARPAPAKPGGLDADRERELLAQWSRS